MTAVLAVHPESALQVAWELRACGAFERCLDALDAYGAFSGELATEAILLRANALMRLRRFSEMIALLDVDPTRFSTIQEASRVRMALAAALSRSGETDRALAILAEVAATPGALDGPRLPAEHAYHEAFARWIVGDDDADADRVALRAASYGDPRWSVGALDVRAYIRLRRGEYHEALRLLGEALDAYRRGGERDDHHEAILNGQIAQIELMLRAADVPGTHVDRRTTAIAYTLSRAMQSAGCSTYVMDAWLSALDGDRPWAFRLSRRAVELSPEPTMYVWALAQRAVILQLLDNHEAAHDHAAEALQVARRIDWAASGPSRYGPLLLAEYFAHHDASLAEELLAMFTSTQATIVYNDTNRDARRIDAHIAFARGLAHRSAGDVSNAHRELLEAYRAFDEVGNRWRAIHALVELDGVPVPDGDPAGYLEGAARSIRADYPRSFLAHRMGPWLRAYDDPIVAGFSPQRKAILRRLLDGATPKTIARTHGLAIATVRNYVLAIQSTFGAHSMQELLLVVRARGLGPPASGTNGAR